MKIDSRLRPYSWKHFLAKNRCLRTIDYGLQKTDVAYSVQAAGLIHDVFMKHQNSFRGQVFHTIVWQELLRLDDILR